MNSRLIVILMIGSMALGACAAPAKPAATPAPPPTATAPGGFPIGTYKPDHVFYTQSILFTGQGTFVQMIGSEDTGKYVVSGDQIVFNRDDGVCYNHPGTYHWEMHGNTLTFKLINDTCADAPRADDLQGRSWILQP